MEKEEIKVSVIIPIYQVEKYIEQGLTSVCEQSLKEIEIICVNDGSQDKSMEIVEKKAALDKRVRILNKENGGLSSARNAGLRNAQGRYILFLDGDDALKSNALEVLYHHMNEYALEQLLFEAEVIYDTPKIKRENYRKYHTYYQRQQDYPEVLNGRDMLYQLVKSKEYRVSACLQMFQREFLMKKRLEFWEGIIQEDNLFTPKALWVAEKVMVLKEALYIRRLHETSIMMSKDATDSSWGYYICMCEVKKFISADSVQEKQCIQVIADGLLQESVSAVCDYEKVQILQALTGKANEEEVKEYIKTVWESDYMAYRRSIPGRFKYWLIRKMRLG